MRDQVERLGKLSVDLLDLSRLESGSLELRPEEVDLGELTRSVSGEFEPTLAQHDRRLELRAAERPIEAQCDPVRVAQIMRILIDNALTHTPSGHQIVVTAARDERPRRAWPCATTARASTAPASQRIFEPFYTADDAQGSGLGLAIASELAERMDGGLTADSRARPHDLHAGAPGVTRRPAAAAACRCGLLAAARSPPAAATPHDAHQTVQRDVRRGHPARRRRGGAARSTRRAIYRPRVPRRRDRPSRLDCVRRRGAALGSGFVSSTAAARCRRTPTS